jgi:hypothetical protein
MSVLQSLVNYRLLLEKEGSSKAHLSNYDRLINQECLTLKNEKTNDINLINFRIHRSEEGASKEELSIIDAHIFKSLGTQQARFEDITIRKLSGDNFNISVDLNSETIGDLYNKVANYLDDSIGRIKLIYRGKHLELMEMKLSYIHIDKNSVIGLTFRLGCGGRGCCDVNFNILSDSLLRNTESVFNKFSEEEKRNIVGGFSKVVAIEELTRQVEEKTRELNELKEKIRIENSKYSKGKKVLFDLSIETCSLIKPISECSFIEACVPYVPSVPYIPSVPCKTSDTIIDEDDLYG